MAEHRLTLDGSLRGFQHQRREDTSVQPSWADYEHTTQLAGIARGSPLLRDNVLEGLHHPDAILARIKLLSRLDDIKGVQEL
jgi:hypothetical protein